jgi:hypothetical protein
MEQALANFEMVKASLIREGTDLSFLACGEAVIPAFAAAEVRNYKRFPKMAPGLQKPGPSSNTSCVEKA